MKLFLFLLGFALAGSFQSNAQRFYYRVAATYDKLRLDKAPFAKSSLTIDYINKDSASIVGKVFYKNWTTEGGQIWLAKDQSKLVMLETEDMDGFLVTSRPVDNTVDWSLYYSFKKEKMRDRIPAPQTGQDEWAFLVNASRHIVDPRTKTYYTVYYDLQNLNGGNFEDQVPETAAFKFIAPDTIAYGRFLYIQKVPNVYVRQNNYGSILLTKMENGSLLISPFRKPNAGYFAPTKELADKLIAEDYSPKADAEKLGKKFDEYLTNKDSLEKQAADASWRKTINSLVAHLGSSRTDPAFEVQIRKKFTDPETTITRIYFLSQDWQVMKNEYGVILSKYLFTALLLKNKGKCSVTSFYIRYPYLGGGNYADTFELGRTNEHGQPGGWDWKDEDGKLTSLTIGNYYEYDCVKK